MKKNFNHHTTDIEDLKYDDKSGMYVTDAASTNMSNKPSGSNPLNRFATYMLALGIMSPLGMVLFTSCRGNDQPEPEPQQTDQVFNIGSIGDVENNAAKIDESITNKFTTAINIKSFGVPALKKYLMNNFPKWAKSAGVTINANGQFVFPDGKTILGLPDLDWTKIIPIGKNPDGTMFFVSFNDLQAYGENGWGNVIRLDAPAENYGNNVDVTTCTNPSDLVNKTNEIVNTPSKDSVALVLQGYYALTNEQMNALKQVINRENTVINSNNAITKAGSDSTNLGDVAQAAKITAALKNMVPSTYDGGNYFYVDCDVDGNEAIKEQLAELAKKTGVVRIRSASASSSEVLQQGVVPDKMDLDQDLYAWPEIPAGLAQYPKTIRINSPQTAQNSGGAGKAPFRATSTTMPPFRLSAELNPAWYSTPSSRALGEGKRLLQFTYNPIIGPYHYEGQGLGTDFGKDAKIKAPQYTYDFFGGNFPWQQNGCFQYRDPKMGEYEFRRP